MNDENFLVGGDEIKMIVVYLIVIIGDRGEEFSKLIIYLGFYIGELFI